MLVVRQRLIRCDRSTTSARPVAAGGDATGTVLGPRGSGFHQQGGNGRLGRARRALRRMLAAFSGVAAPECAGGTPGASAAAGFSSPVSGAGTAACGRRLRMPPAEPPPAAPPPAEPPPGRRGAAAVGDRHARLDAIPHVGGRLDRIDHGGKLAQTPLPAAHDLGKSLIDRNQRLRLGPLVAAERAEHVFGRQHVLVLIDRHDPRHSRKSIKLRLSQVLIVFTGLSNLAASCSRLHPL